MKRVKDIRESYNLVTEKEEADLNKLTSLVRAGLFDAKKLPMLKRILQKDVNKMTPAEKKILIELLDSLMSEVLHSQQVFSKVKQNVSHKDLNEAKDYLSKFDPRFGPKQPTEGDLPAVLILKRKAIRVYPDQQKVALYYSQALDRYISIPFDNITYGMNEETITLSEKKKADANTEAAIKYAYSQIKKNKNKGEDFADTPSKYLTKKQENQAIRLAARDATDQGDLEKLASVGAYKVGSMIRRLFTGPGAKERPKAPETAPPAPKKPVAAPAAPVTSMSGKFTQKMPSMVQPMKASVNIPKAQTSAPAPVVKTPAIKAPAPSKKMSKVPGTGEQPSAPAGGFGFTEPAAKTKTFSYQTATTGARGLSPLEKSSGKIDPKKQVPRKRYGFDPKPAGVGPQPDIGKTKVKAAFLKKLSEDRNLQEVAPALAIPLVVGGVRLAAPHVGRLVSKYAPTIAKSLGVGVAAKATTDKIKDAADTAAREREDEKEIGAKFDANKALIKRQRADERDAAEIAKVTSTAARKVETPAIPKTADDIELTKIPEKSKGVDLPAPPQAVSVDTPGQKAGVATPAPAISQPADVADVASAAAAKSLAQTKATAGTKVDAKAATDTMAKPAPQKDKNTGKNRPRPRPRLLPSLSGDRDSDLKKFTQPGGFSLQAKINRPSEFDPLDTRKERERQRFLKSLSEEDDDAIRREVERRMNRKVYSRPKSFGTLKVNTSTPKGRSTDAVRSERERQAFSRTPIDDLQEIRNQNIKESAINIAGNQVIINNTIANRILNLYESLEDSNKQKMKEMLGESVDSFKKIVNFAVRQ